MLISKFSKIGIEIFHIRFEIKYHPFIFENTEFSPYKCSEENDKVLLLKIKGHTHNILGLRIGQDKTCENQS